MNVEFDEVQSTNFVKRNTSESKDPFLVSFLIRNKIAATKSGANSVLLISSLIALVIAIIISAYFVFHVGVSTTPKVVAPEVLKQQLSL